ncbi:cytochrome P450 4d2-like isoform X1 [Diorhabda carinulata]|uniref:cytochrome P450 4d2-like isoform X1 n=2 Tax=Diorhabda carinulata TaxID=1163345 RepID=UPI0025A17289|nr:cytochrome P450 4d2-like isoform X1 [Diorhabda carinulata]
MDMWVSGVIVAMLIVTVIFLINWYYNMWMYNDLNVVPGPKPLPIIGNANDIGNTTVSLLQSFMKLHLKYGNFYKLWLGPRLHVIIAKPEYLEELLTSNVNLAKSNGYDLFKPWLGDGLLVSTGKKWKTRRRMITPTFHFKILEEFMKVFNKEFNVLLEILKQKVKENPEESIDITEPINLASLDTICETAFGTPLNAQHNGNPGYVKAVTSFLEIFTLRFFSSWLRNPILFRLSSHYEKYSKNLKILHDFTNKIIKERRREFRSRTDNPRHVSEEGIKKRAALLDMLMETTVNGEELTDEDIREEVDTFMFEGHDTSATAICYVLYAIAQNPIVQNRVYQEILEVLGNDKTTEITISKINDLKYLDIVVKEAFRIYSPVPLIERRLEEDWILDGVRIPKNTSVSIFIYGMNHDPTVFPDPERFDPERFLPEKQSTRHTYGFIPFSAGPRNCIGQKYAVYQVKTCLIKIIMEFEMIEDKNFTPEIGMCSVLKSRNGIKIKLKPRYLVQSK